MGNGKVIFWGTSVICLPFLVELNEKFDLKLIITQPDAVGGRRKKTLIPPVKAFGEEHAIEVLQPHGFKDPEILAKLESIEADIGVVIAYGRFLPRRVFSIPVHNTVNVHFSMLPQYRGAAPVQRALENGDTRTGISIFELTRKMDAGDIWAQQEVSIHPEDTTETLWQRMSRDGAIFMGETLLRILNGQGKKIPQDHNQATFAPMVDKKEGEIHWTMTAREIYNRFRAFNPWPGVFFKFKGKLFKLKKILPIDSECYDFTPIVGDLPGKVISLNPSRLRVLCASSTAIEIMEFQPEGKKVMTPYQYSLGNKLPDYIN